MQHSKTARLIVAIVREYRMETKILPLIREVVLILDKGKEAELKNKRLT